jgi:hypothetical protein
MDEQEREQAPPFRASEKERTVGADHFERTENPKLHRSASGSTGPDMSRAS